MKVWFGCTTAQWETYRDNYFAIRNHLIQLGCVVIFDWLEDADKAYETKRGKSRNIKKIYQDVLQAISQADAVIIEHTIPNFSSAHQINYALLRRKPTLVMRTRKDNEHFTDSYIEAIDSPLLTIKEYDLQNYQAIIQSFIGVNSVGNDEGRYNVVLNRKHKYYLDWAATKYKESRSAILRKSLDKTIDLDTDYHKHIKLPSNLF
jgi:hypothetical protein